MFVNHAHRVLPVRLIEPSPGKKTCACFRAQNATYFAQREADIAEEHYTEARGSKIKATVAEGK
jgi:hypothetical protein